jgi:hypothetical protein
MHACFRTALLIVRAWVERGSSAPLRANIRLAKDVSGKFEPEVTVASPAAGAEAVRVFLQEVVDADQRDADGESARDVQLR